MDILPISMDRLPARPRGRFVIVSTALHQKQKKKKGGGLYYYISTIVSVTFISVPISPIIQRQVTINVKRVAEYDGIRAYCFGKP